MTNALGPGPDFDLSGRSLWLVLTLLTLLAAVPRVAELGALSYYGDEETSTFPAQALAEGRGAEMPSGMDYRRGLTYTWVAAGTARLLGTERDLSYRLPSALFGVLTVPLLFLFGRRHLGTSVALVAATALALSEWHLVFSRMARMYVPFVFFFLAAGYAIWRWAETGRPRDLVIAALAFAAAALTHSLAVFAVMFALIPIGLKGSSKVAPAGLAAFAGVAAVASRVYDRLLVDAPFQQWESVPAVQDAATGAMAEWPLGALTSLLGPDWLLGGVGLALGAWTGVRALRVEGELGLSIRAAGMLAATALAGGLLALGQVWGAAGLALVFLTVLSADRLEALRAAALPVGLAVLLGAGTVVADVLSLGLVAGLKEAVVFPFPYLLYLFRAFPVLVLLFGAVCVWAVLRPRRSEGLGVRAVLLAALLPILAVGSARGWSHLRFLLPAYPFVLLCASAALVAGVAWIGERLGRAPRWAVVGVPVAVVLAGLVGGHGVATAWEIVTLRHGEPVSEAVHQQAFRPDHESAGRYVREARRPGDLVVAEDPLQQHWYAGGVDFWFRSYGDARAFLFPADDGWYRDMYVRSALVRDGATIDSIAGDAGGRVWFVTSGETIDERDIYLDEDQRRWLDSLERTRRPAYLARDSATKVFCLNCPEGAPPPGG